MKDDLRVSFVIPGFQCDEFIERNLTSLLDQDYKNWDAMVVLNGVWPTKESLVLSLREKFGSDKIRIMSIPESGLGNANNVGFKTTDGDIISHLSSDLYLMPGALKTWVDAFNEHPDCGLVYSGYRFAFPDPSKVYLSNEFNLHHLRCENYVDGANPYRREFAPKWDTKLKSLIDWDAMLQIAEKTKGYYIKEPLYYAELPKLGGLSDDSDRNWIKRWRAVRDKHGIPESSICIASLDDPPMALAMAELLNVDFRMNPGFKPHEYRLIYAYSFNCSLERLQYNSSMFMRHFGHKVIHWVGSDLRELMKLRWVDVDYYSTAVLKRISEHWCMTNRDKDILRKMGVDSDVVYPPIDLSDRNGIKRVGISVNDHGLYEHLRKAMPDQAIYHNDLSCDITIHFEDDPKNIIKSICMGNKVISNNPMAGIYYVQAFTNVPELRKMLVHIIRKIRKDDEKPEQETMDSYRAKVNPGKFRERLERIADKHIQKYGKLEEIVVKGAEA